MPFIANSEALAPLLARVRMNLDITQEELAKALGVTRKTIGRWQAQRSTPSLKEIARLAEIVHPRDPAMAAQIAAEAGTTLAALGLETAAEKVAAPAASAGPRPRQFPPVDLMMDAILHVAERAMAEGAGEDPASLVRRVLKVAFARARGLGLTTAEVDEALTARAGGAASQAVERVRRRA